MWDIRRPWAGSVGYAVIQELTASGESHRYFNEMLTRVSAFSRLDSAKFDHLISQVRCTVSNLQSVRQGMVLGLVTGKPTLMFFASVIW
jgi:hypothetical protein